MPARASRNGAGVAVVTGGSRGIGRSIVDRLVTAGYDVVTCGRSERPHDLDDSVAWVRADVSAATDAQRVVEEARRLGEITALVNNAGVQVERTVLDSTDADWDLVVGVNCRGVFNMSRAALAEMQDRGGVIVNIGSISGESADPCMALYNASKGFVHALTRSIAVDHGPRVRCNAVSPGWIATDMAEDAFALAADPAAAKEDAVARHAVGRLGAPQDIASVVAWLLSDESSFLTGQCVTVDGGLTAASPLRPQLF